MSYSLTSHNFGLNILTYGFINTNFNILLFLLTINCLVIMYIFYFKLIYNIINLNRLLKPLLIVTKQSYVTVFYLFIILLITYLISLYPIINNVFINSFNIDLLNVLSNHSNLKISIPLITFVLLTQYNLFYIINIVFYIFVTKYYTTVMLTTYTLKIITMLTRSLHTLVIFITSTNTSLQNTVLVL